MKYKVGDKVRIREDLEEGVKYGGDDTVPEMVAKAGEFAKITAAYSRSYRLDIDDENWCWTDEMLEPAEESSDELDDLPDEQADMIQKPPHYNKFSFQPIDIIAEVTNYYEGSTAFHIGTVLKYLCRAPFKGKLLEDLKKANYYLTRAIEEMEE